MAVGFALRSPPKVSEQFNNKVCRRVIGGRNEVVTKERTRRVKDDRKNVPHGTWRQRRGRDLGDGVICPSQRRGPT
jgi:hypothetical protein